MYVPTNIALGNQCTVDFEIESSYIDVIVEDDIKCIESIFKEDATWLDIKLTQDELRLWFFTWKHALMVHVLRKQVGSVFYYWERIQPCYFFLKTLVNCLSLSVRLKLETFVWSNDNPNYTCWCMGKNSSSSNEAL